MSPDLFISTFDLAAACFDRVVGQSRMVM